MKSQEKKLQYKTMQELVSKMKYYLPFINKDGLRSTHDKSKLLIQNLGDINKLPLPLDSWIAMAELRKKFIDMNDLIFYLINKMTSPNETHINPYRFDSEKDRYFKKYEDEELCKCLEKIEENVCLCMGRDGKIDFYVEPDYAYCLQIKSGVASILPEDSFRWDLYEFLISRFGDKVDHKLIWHYVIYEKRSTRLEKREDKIGAIQRWTVFTPHDVRIAWDYFNNLLNKN